MGVTNEGLAATMRSNLGNWASGIDDVELAWALLGLGILAPRQRTAGTQELSALEEKLRVRNDPEGEDQGCA